MVALKRNDASALLDEIDLQEGKDTSYSSSVTVQIPVDQLTLLDARKLSRSSQIRRAVRLYNHLIELAGAEY